MKPILFKIQKLNNKTELQRELYESATKVRHITIVFDEKEPIKTEWLHSSRSLNGPYINHYADKYADKPYYDYFELSVFGVTVYNFQAIYMDYDTSMQDRAICSLDNGSTIQFVKLECITRSDLVAKDGIYIISPSPYEETRMGDIISYLGYVANKEIDGAKDHYTDNEDEWGACGINELLQ